MIYAQRNEIGVFAGTSCYIGDLNPTGFFSQPKFATGLLYRYNFDTRWAMRINAHYANVTANDAKYENPRNLDFKSTIYELSATGEINFLTFFTGSKRLYRFTPYLFGGIGVFFFNPQGTHYDANTNSTTWVDLRPLSTEGQNMPEYPDKSYYNSASLAIPFGLGFKFSLSKHLTLGVELGIRKTFTDYLDDVSTTYADPYILRTYISELSADMSDKSVIPNAVGSERGNASSKDWYHFAGISLLYKIYPEKDHNCPAYHNARSKRVPSIFAD
ncbi:hypothetical protein FACS1894153_0890 [Bacteroidia bacterium]|nr:hypothetical protein FACS1894153_0890 [Bacteroidia bacterium]